MHLRANVNICLWYICWICIPIFGLVVGPPVFLILAAKNILATHRSGFQESPEVSAILVFIGEIASEDIIICNHVSAFCEISGSFPFLQIQQTCG